MYEIVWLSRLSPLLCVLISLTATPLAQAQTQENATAFDNPLHVHAFDLPVSDLVSSETKAALESMVDVAATVRASCRGRKDFGPCTNQLWSANEIRQQRKLYNVQIENNKINGVEVTIVRPTAGIASRNAKRILINPGHSAVEAIPVSAIGQIEVVSIDLFSHPKSTVDQVEKVYEALSRQYPHANIGIYGCDAERVAELRSIKIAGLPMPGASAVITAPFGGFTADSDSARLDIAAFPLPSDRKPEDMREQNAKVIKALRPEELRGFPPTLFVVGTRDPFLSSAAFGQEKLNAAGVATELHIFESMTHGFALATELPEARRTDEIIVHFFDRNLGT